MRTVPLAGTGVRVSPVTLGTLNFGRPLGEAESVRMVRHALDAGINAFDTANVYHDGRAEEYLGKGLEGRRDQAIVVSKVCDRVGPGPNDRGLSRRHILDQVERTLSRLRTDHLDVYVAHMPDADTPLDETLAALDDLVRQGKVIYIGCSNHTPLQLCEALWESDRRDLARFAVDQVPYHVFDRRAEVELAPFCGRRGVGIMAYRPFAGGVLGGRLSSTPPEDSRCARVDVFRSWYERIPERVFADVRLLDAVAREAGTTLSRLALAWVLRREWVGTAVIGPRTPEQVDDAIAALDLALDPEVEAAVDRINPPGGFAWFHG